jgi:hypothetical protein
VSAGCVGPRAAAPAAVATSTPAAPAAPTVAAAAPVAVVDGKAIDAAALTAHARATGLARAEALDDLIDLTLLRQATHDSGIALPPGEPSAEARANAEYELARKQSLDVPAATEVLVVNHAWVKDASQPKTRAAERKSLEKLRALVAAGATIPAAYQQLAIPGANWHIGDHEEYPYDVVPAEAHDLPAGSLSAIIPGDGGLHLFTVIEHKRTLPPPTVVRAALHEALRAGKTIELPPAT